MRQLRKLSHLEGYHFQARDDEIGRLVEIYFDDRRWQTRYLVAQTGSWLFGRDVLLVPDVITGIDDGNSDILVELTRQQIENAPPVNSEQPVSKHYQQTYYRYYEWPPFWTVDPLFNALPPQPYDQADKLRKPEHPHLRSSAEVTGYQLQAEDGLVGHVADFILDDQDWTVRYLEIDTRNWLPGRHVLLPPAWVKGVDWGQQEVVVRVKQDLIKQAPEYDPSQVISREYQLALYKHYGKVYED